MSEKANFDPNNVIIRLPSSGRLFRCSCGANVFTQLADNRYECNSCKTTYAGE